MYTALMLLVLGGGGDDKVSAPAQTAPQAICESCQDGNCRRHGGDRIRARRKRQSTWKLGMMPQSCYDPSYGCYPGSRYMNRYPAFHGSYYRRPYNYRQLFNYPWHAAKHEPTSMFSYNVQSSEETGGSTSPLPLPPPPQARRTPRRPPRLR